MTKLIGGFRAMQRQIRYLAGYLELGRNAPVRRLTDFGRCRRPVLLLHGLFCTRRSLDVLERRLRRDGYCVFSLNLGGLAQSFNGRGIEHLANHVHLKVERIYHRNPALGPLTIIGHSKGGLIGAYYVKKLGGWRRTRALLTLGSPHGGTAAAYAALPMGVLARSILQMRPSSPFLRELHDGSWPSGVRFVSLYSKKDKVVRFPSSLIETFNLSYLRNVEVDAHGHREFLFRKRVYDVLLTELRQGEESASAMMRNLTMAPAPAPPPHVEALTTRALGPSSSHGQRDGDRARPASNSSPHAL